MAKQIKYVCDACGTVRGGTNHWFSVVVKPDLVQIYHSQALLDIDGTQHICGQGCLQKLISCAIATGGNQRVAFTEAATK